MKFNIKQITVCANTSERVNPITHQTHKKLGPRAPDPSFSPKPNHHQPLKTHSKETTTITHTKQLKTHKNSQPITSIGQTPGIHHLSLQNQPNHHPKFPSLLNCIKPNYHPNCHTITSICPFTGAKSLQFHGGTL